MTREEILEKSRIENRNHDEMERDALARAGQRACAVGGLVCAAIIILEAIFTEHVNLGTWAVYLSITGTMLLVKYLYLKKRHELIFGMIQIGLAIAFLVSYILQLTVR